MSNISEEQIKSIGNILNDPKRPLKERFRALFTLRNIGGLTSMEYISKSFNDKSVLLKHELAYCLGQMQDERANSILIGVLEDVDQDPMVRHEAAEALGAIGSIATIPILKKYQNDPVVEVAETCELALERINWVQNSKDAQEEPSKNPYRSIDPAPAYTSENVEELKRILLADESTIFQRYRAMFTLRNIGTKDSIEALNSGLNCGSALFRHEIAFVLGQMQNELSVKALKKSLENNMESEMVRHECAEALGAIATDECMEILKKYVSDNKRVVKESCEIALDMCEYENSFDFQYANSLESVR